MALAIDASSPAIATQANNATATVTTASFTPPSGSLLYIRWAWNNNSGDTPTAPSITDSLGAHLTYTLLDWQSKADAPNVNAMAAHWSAVGNGNALTITTTANATTAHAGGLSVLVFTDGASTPLVGAHGKAGQASNTSIAQGYTAVATGSMGLIGVADWDNASHAAGSGMTSTNGGTAQVGSGSSMTYVFFRRSAFDGVQGATTTLNDTVTGATGALNWVYAEITPVATGSWTSGFDVRIG